MDCVDEASGNLGGRKEMGSHSALRTDERLCLNHCPESWTAELVKQLEHEEMELDSNLIKSSLLGKNTHRYGE